jgi:hypothetical protein
VILRRGGWREPDELHEALERASAESDRLDVAWLRSYVLAEIDGSLGTVCVYDRAGLPVDEIVAVADTAVVEDAAAPAASVRGSLWETGGEGGSRCT